MLRIRACRGDLDFSERGLEGNSRKNALYMDRSF